MTVRKRIKMIKFNEKYIQVLKRIFVQSNAITVLTGLSISFKSNKKSLHWIEELLNCLGMWATKNEIIATLNISFFK